MHRLPPSSLKAEALVGMVQLIEILVLFPGVMGLDFGLGTYPGFGIYSGWEARMFLKSIFRTAAGEIFLKILTR